ncbi:MAG: hypothetical protein WCO56_09170 [Verrucomicrobiota bacterium]
MIWLDCETGQERAILEPKGAHANIAVVAVSPGGQFGLSGEDEGGVKLWELATGRELRRFNDGRKDGIRSLRFSPSGQVFASANAAGIITFWDVASGEKLRAQQFGDTQGPEGTPPSRLAAKVVFSKDLRIALWGTKYRGLGVWLLTDKPLVKKHIHSCSGFVRMSPDGLVGLSLYNYIEPTLCFWDLRTDNPLLEIRFKDQPSSAVFSADGKRVLVGTKPRDNQKQNDSLFLWDLVGNKKVWSYPAGHRVSAVAFSVDGRLAISSGDEFRSWSASEAEDVEVPMRLWEVATGKLLQKFCWMKAPSAGPQLPNKSRMDIELRFREIGTRRLTGVALLPGTNLALTVSEDSTAILWDMGSGLQVRSIRLDSHPRSMRYSDHRPGVSLLPGGHSLLVLGVGGNSIKHLDITNLTEINTFPQTESYGMYGHALFEGELLVANDEEAQLNIWELKTRRLIRTITPSLMGTAATSINGKQLVCLSQTNLMFCDFSFPEQFRNFEPRLLRARELLNRDPKNAEALAILGEWYAFLGLWDWAIEVLELSRSRGFTVSSLALARSYWKSGQPLVARQEFTRALKQGDAPEYYLQLCINSLKDDATSAPPSGQSLPQSEPRTVRAVEDGFLDPLNAKAMLNHQGQLVKVKGKIVKFGTSKSGTFYFLNFAENYRSALTLAFKQSDNPAEFRPETLKEYVNKTVIVEGKIIDYQGAPEIIITTLAGIKVQAESQPTREEASSGDTKRKPQN